MGRIPSAGQADGQRYAPTLEAVQAGVAPAHRSCRGDVARGLCGLAGGGAG